MSSFPSQDIKHNVFRQLMTSYTLRFMLDQALKQWLTRRKRGEDGNTKKMNISRTKKSFLNEIKTSLIVFEGLSFGEEYKFIKK